MTKIIFYQNLDKLIKKLKGQRKSIALVGGCFDVLHPGHTTFLKKSKNLANVLLVALENDKKVTLLKGKNRPVNNQLQRAKNLAKLACADYITILPTLKTNNDYLKLVKKITPDFIAITKNDPKTSQKAAQAKAVKAKLKTVTSRLAQYSTTKKISQPPIILAIETSCDETAVAITKNSKILSSITASSQTYHAKTGGIIPESAARHQIKLIIPTIKHTLSQLDTSPYPLNTGRYLLDSIDAIAVTTGPGLIGSLLVGVETAKTLSIIFNKPLIPVNHLLGHIYVNFINLTPKKVSQLLPAIVLTVSGGHTQLLLMKTHQNIKLLGQTKDDAAGECFDKCARLLNLPYPGGPEIEKKAELFDPTKKSPNFNLPRPMLNQKNLDFSFSGLKTAVLNLIKKQKPAPQNPELAWQIQEAITDVLVKKTIKAAVGCHPNSIIIGGGVAANQRLIQKFKNQIKKESLNLKFLYPKKHLATDNAVGIAIAASYHFKPVPFQKISANPNLPFPSR